MNIVPPVFLNVAHPLSMEDRVIEALKQGPAHNGIIAARAQLCYTTAWRWATRLHARKAIHISSWGRVQKGGPYAPTYTFGPGVDVERPAERNHRALTESAEVERQRKRAKQAQERVALRKKADVEQAILRGQVKAHRRDPLVAALFGTGSAHA